MKVTRSLLCKNKKRYSNIGKYNNSYSDIGVPYFKQQHSLSMINNHYKSTINKKQYMYSFTSIFKRRP